MVSRRVACLRPFSVAVAAVLLPTMAAGAPIPGLRMGPERAVSYGAATAAIADHGGHALESLWSTLSGSPGLRTGHAEGGGSAVAAALSWMGSAFGAGGNRNAGNRNAIGSMLSEASSGAGFGGSFGAGAHAQSANSAPLTAGILQAHDNHREFAPAEAAAALSATLPFSQFTDEGHAIALAFPHRRDGRAGEWASAGLFSNPGQAHLKTEKARNAEQDGNAGKHEGAQDNGGSGDGQAVTAVPEPNSLFLLGTGAAALLATARRRKFDR